MSDSPLPAPWREEAEKIAARAPFRDQSQITRDILSLLSRVQQETLARYENAQCVTCAAHLDTDWSAWSEPPKGDAPQAEAALLDSMRKVRAHTSYLPGAPYTLLAGLLQSIERIADDALGAEAPAPSAPQEEQFFLAVNGDGGPTTRVIVGREAVRRALKEEFFGPEPLDNLCAEHEAARWAKFSDPDEWSECHGQPFTWSESGEDYTLVVFRMSAPPEPEGEV